MLTRRGVGLGLIAIAAFLYAARYVSAAIFGSGVKSWDAELFRAMYGYVGSGLTTAAIIALVAGIVFIVFGELTEGRSRGDGSQG
jgi:hypothetical protein